LFQALSTCLNSFVLQALNGCTSLDPKPVRNVYHHHQSVSDMNTTFAELINKNIKKDIHIEIWQLETLFWLLLRAPAGIPGHSKEFFLSLSGQEGLCSQSLNQHQVFNSRASCGQATLTGQGMKIHSALNDLFSVSSCCYTSIRDIDIRVILYFRSNLIVSTGLNHVLCKLLFA